MNRGSSSSSNDANNDEWDWYNGNREEIHQEFLELLEASVLSRMFGNEIEYYHRKKNPSIMQGQVDEVLGKVGSRNRTTSGGVKRKGGHAAAGKSAQKNGTNKKQNIVTGNDDEKKPDKDIYFSFGELIQLAYKKEPFKKDRSSRTILFQSSSSNKESSSPLEPSAAREPKKNDGSKTPEKLVVGIGTGTFRDRQKLSHRLLIWISKSEAAASSASTDGELSSSKTEGIYRTEMIPISSLFRKPAELMTLSDDEEEDD